MRATSSKVLRVTSGGALEFGALKRLGPHARVNDHVHKLQPVQPGVGAGLGLLGVERVACIVMACFAT